MLYCFRKGFKIYPKVFGSKFKVFYTLGGNGQFYMKGKEFSAEESYQAIWDFYTQRFTNTIKTNMNSLENSLEKHLEKELELEIEKKLKRKKEMNSLEKLLEIQKHLMKELELAEEQKDS